MRPLSAFPATAAAAFPATAAALAALALSTCLAHGQVSHSAATRGSCTLAAIGGGTTGSHVVPAGTDVSEGLHVVILSGAGDSLAALDVRSSAGELQMRASCVPMWPGAQAQVSRAEVIMQISAPAAVSGRLLLEVEVTLGGSASGIAGIDVDDDGVDDISSSSGAQQLTLNRSLGPTPIAVRVHVEGFAVNVEPADVRARVRVEGPPPRFLISEVNRQGFGCPYNALLVWGDSRNRGVWLHFNIGGVFAIGTQRAALLLEPACWLYVVPPAAVVPAPASQVMVPTPAALLGTVFVQAFGVLDGRLQGSNCMLVSLR
jgi:hypothetical protein